MLNHKLMGLVLVVAVVLSIDVRSDLKQFTSLLKTDFKCHGLRTPKIVKFVNSNCLSENL